MGKYALTAGARLLLREAHSVKGLEASVTSTRKAAWRLPDADRRFVRMIKRNARYAHARPDTQPRVAESVVARRMHAAGSTVD
jgi:hypothetical protein